MISRITLVRHGRSAHTSGGWFDAAALNRWFEEYDAAGIQENSHPPPMLIEHARHAGIVVASDMPRARASAERLLPGVAIPLSQLLREIPLPMPPFGSIRLPLSAWALAAGTRWAYAQWRGARPMPRALEQGEAAAAWLIELAAVHGSVLAVNHANLRTLIARALLDAGWQREPGGKQLAHWSAWTFTRET